MRVSNFRADAHATGARIDVSWDVVPEPGEDPSLPLPEVRVRRKTRDFEFPPQTGDDPFLLYDSAAFLADRVEAPRFAVEGSYQVEEVEEIQGPEDGPGLRRWILTYALNGVIHHWQVRIADQGPIGGELSPGTVYYYQLLGPEIPTTGNLALHRAVAQATGRHGLGEQAYGFLPAILQQLDEAGELRQFVSLPGDQLDLLRSLADALPDLKDVDNTGHQYLPGLAQWLGWDLNYAAPIPIRRHEIKYAASLFRVTGTLLGCQIWVKRLTGWQSEIKEFYRNVLFSNDLGNPDDPTDQGSRTVDTSDPELLARISQHGDDLDYTYDTGTTELDWYAYNCVGILVRPNEGETVSTVLRKKTNLVNNLALFLPVNMRGVVIMDTESRADTSTDAMNLLAGTSDEGSP